MVKMAEADRSPIRTEDTLKLKSKVCEVTLTRRSECWAMKTNNTSKIATTEMRMLRGMLVVS